MYVITGNYVTDECHHYVNILNQVWFDLNGLSDNNLGTVN